MQPQGGPIQLFYVLVPSQGTCKGLCLKGHLTRFANHKMHFLKPFNSHECIDYVLLLAEVGVKSYSDYLNNVLKKDVVLRVVLQPL